jgi:hypothetical protein
MASTPECESAITTSTLSFCRRSATTRAAAVAMSSKDSGAAVGVTFTASLPSKPKIPTFRPPTILMSFVLMGPGSLKASRASSSALVAEKLMLLATSGTLTPAVCAACKMPASPLGVQSSSWLPIVVAS